jgi:hypothetical protein
MKPSDAPRLEGWTTATEIADELGISRQTVNQMFWNDEFKTLRRVGPPDTKRPMFVVKTAEFNKVRASRHFPRSPNQHGMEATAAES